MFLSSVRTLINRVAQPGERGRRQTGSARRCSSPREKRVRLLCERLEDRLAPAVFFKYGGPGTDAIVGESTPGRDTIEITEFQLGQQNLLELDLGPTVTFGPNSTAAAIGLRYQVTNSPGMSHYATINTSEPDDISTLEIHLTEQDKVILGLIPNPNRGIENLRVEAGMIDFIGRIFIPGNESFTAKEAVIDGNTSILGSFFAHDTTVKNGGTATFTGNSVFLGNVNDMGTIILDSNASASAVDNDGIFIIDDIFGLHVLHRVTNRGSFFVNGGLTTADLTNEGNFLANPGSKVTVFRYDGLGNLTEVDGIVSLHQATDLNANVTNRGSAEPILHITVLDPTNDRIIINSPGPAVHIDTLDMNGGSSLNIESTHPNPSGPIVNIGEANLKPGRETITLNVNAAPSSQPVVTIGKLESTRDDSDIVIKGFFLAFGKGGILKGDPSGFLFQGDVKIGHFTQQGGTLTVGPNSNVEVGGNVSLDVPVHDGMLSVEYHPVPARASERT